MVALMIVVIDKGFDLSFEVTWHEVVFQHEEGQGKAPVGRFLRRTVLQGLMPTFDFALCLGMVWCATGMLHTFAMEPFSEVSGDVT